MGAFTRFTTEVFTRSDRLEGWSAHWRSSVGLEICPWEQAEFSGTIEARDIGPLRVCRISVGGHTIERTRSLIGQVDRDLLKLVFQVGGETCIAQGDERTILRPGEWMVYDMSRPYRLFNSAPTEQVALMLPRSAFAGLADGARLLAARSSPVTAGASKLLQRCTLGVLDDLGEGDTPLDRDVAPMLLDLVRLTLNERLGARERISVQETMQARISSYIRRNLHDPELNLDRVALAMGCTKRYLHKIFSEDQTISEYIWTMRLRRCGEELVAPENANRSITDIAFANGFSNSAHFSRVFKAFYGVAPRAYRIRGCEARIDGTASGPAGPGVRPH